MVKILTFDDLQRLVAEANMVPLTKEEIIFDEAVLDAIGYYPNWRRMTVH